ncbi:hypothetical protein ACSBR1_017119 [Camellia fascicularis]
MGSELSILYVLDIMQRRAATTQTQTTSDFLVPSTTTLLLKSYGAGSNFLIDRILLPTSVISLGILDFQNLEKLSSKLFQNLASLQILGISGCPRLKSLPVQRLPSSLNAVFG